MRMVLAKLALVKGPWIKTGKFRISRRHWPSWRPTALNGSALPLFYNSASRYTGIEAALEWIQSDRNLYQRRAWLANPCGWFTGVHPKFRATSCSETSTPL